MFRTRHRMEREDGGAEGTRTPDIHTASVVFSQLNYSPTLSQAVLYHVANRPIQAFVAPPDHSFAVRDPISAPMAQSPCRQQKPASPAPLP